MNMRYFCAVIFLAVAVSICQGQNCRVAASCTRSGRNYAVLRRLIFDGSATVSVSVPSVQPAMQFQKDDTASQNCKAPGWIIGVNGYQYKIITSLATWDEALDLCKGVGGSLPRRAFDSDDAYEFLVALMKSNGDKYGFWLPLSDRATENTWVWDDNTPLTTTKYWAQNQPDGSGDCGWISRDMGYKWDDGVCTATFAALCERKV